MSGPTTYGSIAGPTFINDRAERELAKERLAMGEQTTFRIDRHSNTWQAVKEYIRQQTAEDYMPTLRNKGIGHDDTQYARGGLDALESLLEFGGEV